MGYTKAIANLGICYLKGIGTEECSIEAKSCFDEAASKKDP